jgi:CBS domain containing-hemolysin-like protein
MGLDYTEIIMWLEQDFNIEIDDESIAKQEYETVGGLYFYILERMKKQSSTIACPNVPVFFHLRDAFVNCAHVDKSAIKTSTQLKCLIPIVGRKKVCNKFSKK